MFGSDSSGKPKTIIQLIENELKWLHGQASRSSYEHSRSAWSQLVKLQDHLVELNKKANNELIPDRIKAMEATMAEILLMGRDDGTKHKDK